MVARVCVALVAALVLVVSVQAAPCTFKSGSKAYDLSPLVARNGSYAWTDSGSSYAFMLQVCGAVTAPTPRGCSAGGSAYAIGPAGNCTSVGNHLYQAMAEVPSGNGVMLMYFFGDRYNNVAFQQTTVYIECDTVTDLSFEHNHACTYGSMWHFKFKSPHGCPL